MDVFSLPKDNPEGWGSDSAIFAKSYGDSSVGTFYDSISSEFSGSGFFGDLNNELAGMSGWNAVAIHAKALQFSVAESGVYVGPALKRELISVFGEEDEAKANGSVQSGQTENIPDGFTVSHSMYRIRKLMNRPNRWTSEHAFRYQIGLQVEAFGVCYVLVIPTSGGAPSEMFVIPKPFVTWMANARVTVPGESRMSEGGFRIGSLIRSGARYVDDQPARTLREMLIKLSNRVYPDYWVIELGSPHALFPDDFSSVSDSMSDVLQLEKELQASRRSTLNNQMTAGPMLRAPNGVTLTPEQKSAYLNQMQDQYAGVENSGKPWFPPDGITVENGQFSSREMEFAKSVMELRDAILGQRMLSPSILGIGDQSSYAGLVALSRVFTRFSAQPVLNIISGQLSLGLGRFFTAPYNEFFIRLMAATIDDPQLKEQQIGNDLKSLAMTKNEYRRARGWQEWTDERGDEIAGAPAAPEGGPGMPGMPPGGPAPGGATPGEAGTGIGAAVKPSEVGSTATPQADAPEAKSSVDVASSYISKSLTRGSVAVSGKGWVGCHVKGAVRRAAVQWQNSFTSMGFSVPDGHVPHVTLCCPVTSNDDDVLRKFEAIVAGSGPINVFFGACEVFQTENGDCVVAEASGPALFEIQRKLNAVLPNGNLFQFQKPHMTLGYGDSGSGDGFRGTILGGITGERIQLTSVRFEWDRSLVKSVRVGKERDGIVQ